jgi:hypothetical protein
MGPSIPAKREGKGKYRRRANNDEIRCCTHVFGTSVEIGIFHVRTGSTSMELSIAK